MRAVAAGDQDIDAGAAHRGAVVLDGDRDVVGDGGLAEDGGEARVVGRPAAAVGRKGPGLFEEGVLEAGGEVVVGDVVDEAGFGVLVDDHERDILAKIGCANLAHPMSKACNFFGGSFV